MAKFKWLPVVLAILAVAAEMALNLFGSNIRVALWLAVLLLIIQVGILALELQRIKSARPRIEPYGTPFRDERPLVVQAEGQKDKITPLIFFHIKLANNPSLRVEQATAQKVFAELTYYDRTRQKLIGPIIGRWGDTEQPGTRSRFAPTRDLLSVDLESSGLPRELNLALKHLQEKAIYAFNNDSYFHDGWKRPDFIMNEEEVYIHVRLSGENVDDTDLWMLLENRVDSQTIQMTEPLNIDDEQAGI